MLKEAPYLWGASCEGLTSQPEAAPPSAASGTVGSTLPLGFVVAAPLLRHQCAARRAKTRPSKRTMTLTHPQHGFNPEQVAELRKTLGETLQDRRKDLGMTQHELAQEVGFTYYTMISQIELGRTRIPPDKLKDYARALQMDPEDFGKLCLAHYDPYMHELLYGRFPTSALHILKSGAR
ncbi:helix-turn-helix domain-containing protein [Rhodovulum sp. DZ06]|uniref:helix-turn-helix domain-containing protein n=1 Tax=Rhodovulum sp. DZ06 TaxID=3425126 RepID=UPI003D34C26E